MLLTEETVEDKIEIVGKYREILVRTATIIKRDGVEISRSFHRHVITPDSDISGESAEVQAIAKITHTPKIKQDFTAEMAEEVL